jgi:hypothetical protein
MAVLFPFAVFEVAEFFRPDLRVPSSNQQKSRSLRCALSAFPRAAALPVGPSLDQRRTPHSGTDGPFHYKCRAKWVARE